MMSATAATLGSLSSTFLDSVAPSLLTLGLEVNEHRRSNFLHKEQILQALRIHEAETQAQKEYHRVETKQNNDQHSRELFQSKVQHEENIDTERRSAMRENLRDEWSQITEKAETVLIVNTLILGVAFTMLIEGQFPEQIVLQYPLLALTYMCLLSICLATLLLSVRYSMVLRFRVGRTIVNEMRTAIHRALVIDKRFRGSDAYKKCNRAKITIPACDDVSHPTRLRKVQSLPRQMALSRLARGISEGVESAKYYRGRVRSQIEQQQQTQQPQGGPGVQNQSSMWSVQHNDQQLDSKQKAKGSQYQSNQFKGSQVEQQNQQSWIKQSQTSNQQYPKSNSQQATSRSNSKSKNQIPGDNNIPRIQQSEPVTPDSDSDLDSDGNSKDKSNESGTWNESGSGSATGSSSSQTVNINKDNINNDIDVKNQVKKPPIIKPLFQPAPANVVLSCRRRANHNVISRVQLNSRENDMSPGSNASTVYSDSSLIAGADGRHQGGGQNHNNINNDIDDPNNINNSPRSLSTNSSDSSIFFNEFGSIFLDPEDLGGSDLGYTGLDWVGNSCGYNPSFIPKYVEPTVQKMGCGKRRRRGRGVRDSREDQQRSQSWSNYSISNMKSNLTLSNLDLSKFTQETCARRKRPQSQQNRKPINKFKQVSKGEHIDLVNKQSQSRGIIRGVPVTEDNSSSKNTLNVTQTGSNNTSAKQSTRSTYQIIPNIDDNRHSSSRQMSIQIDQGSQEDASDNHHHVTPNPNRITITKQTSIDPMKYDAISTNGPKLTHQPTQWLENDVISRNSRSRSQPTYQQPLPIRIGKGFIKNVVKRPGKKLLAFQFSGNSNSNSSDSNEIQESQNQQTQQQGPGYQGQYQQESKDNVSNHNFNDQWHNQTAHGHNMNINIIPPQDSEDNNVNFDDIIRSDDNDDQYGYSTPMQLTARTQQDDTAVVNNNNHNDSQQLSLDELRLNSKTSITRQIFENQESQTANSNGAKKLNLAQPFLSVSPGSGQISTINQDLVTAITNPVTNLNTNSNSQQQQFRLYQSQYQQQQNLNDNPAVAAVNSINLKTLSGSKSRQQPTIHPGTLPVIYGHEDLALLQEFSDIERSYRSLIDLKLRQDKYLNRKLDILRRNWCIPYDRSAEWCFMVGTVLLLICACLLVTCRWLTRELQPNDYRPDFSSVVYSFMSLTSATLLGHVMLEILIRRKNEQDSMLRKRKQENLFFQSLKTAGSSGDLLNSGYDRFQRIRGTMWGRLTGKTYQSGRSSNRYQSDHSGISANSNVEGNHIVPYNREGTHNQSNNNGNNCFSIEMGSQCHNDIEKSSKYSDSSQQQSQITSGSGSQNQNQQNRYPSINSNTINPLNSPMMNFDNDESSNRIVQNLQRTSQQNSATSIISIDQDSLELQQQKILINDLKLQSEGQHTAGEPKQISESVFDAARSADYDNNMLYPPIGAYLQYASEGEHNNNLNVSNWNSVSESQPQIETWTKTTQQQNDQSTNTNRLRKQLQDTKSNLFSRLPQYFNVNSHRIPEHPSSSTIFGGNESSEQSQELEQQQQNQIKFESQTFKLPSRISTATRNIANSKNMGQGDQNLNDIDINQNVQNMNVQQQMQNWSPEKLAVWEIEQELQFLETNTVVDTLPYWFTPVMLSVLLIISIVFFLVEWIAQIGLKLEVDEEIQFQGGMETGMRVHNNVINGNSDDDPWLKASQGIVGTNNQVQQQSSESSELTTSDATTVSFYSRFLDSPSAESIARSRYSNQLFIAGDFFKRQRLTLLTGLCNLIYVRVKEYFKAVESTQTGNQADQDSAKLQVKLDEQDSIQFVKNDVQLKDVCTLGLDQTSSKFQFHTSVLLTKGTNRLYIYQKAVGFDSTDPNSNSNPNNDITVQKTLRQIQLEKLADIIGNSGNSDEILQSMGCISVNPTHAIKSVAIAYDVGKGLVNPIWTPGTNGNQGNANNNLMPQYKTLIDFDEGGDGVGGSDSDQLQNITVTVTGSTIHNEYAPYVSSINRIGDGYWTFNNVNPNDVTKQTNLVNDLNTNIFQPSVSSKLIRVFPVLISFSTSEGRIINGFVTETLSIGTQQPQVTNTYSFLPVDYLDTRPLFQPAFSQSANSNVKIMKIQPRVQFQKSSSSSSSSSLNLIKIGYSLLLDGSIPYTVLGQISNESEDVDDLDKEKSNLQTTVETHSTGKDGAGSEIIENAGSSWKASTVILREVSSTSLRVGILNSGRGSGEDDIRFFIGTGRKPRLGRFRSDKVGEL